MGTPGWVTGWRGRKDRDASTLIVGPVYVTIWHDNDNARRWHMIHNLPDPTSGGVDHLKAKNVRDAKREAERRIRRVFAAIVAAFGGAESLRRTGGR